MKDDTNTVTYRPPVRRVIRGLLSDYGGLTKDTLVAMTHKETEASTDVVRATVAQMQRNGEIYRAGALWKVTRK